MKKTFGRALNGVEEPHRRESHIGRISTVSGGGKSVTVTNMNNSELRNLVPITPYGISSSPPTGLMAFVLVANNSGRDGIVGIFDPNKPSCSMGDSMIYSSGGATVHCRGRSVLLNTRDVLKEVDDLKTSMKNLEDKVSGLEDRVNDLESTINGLNTTVGGVSSTTSNIESTINDLSATVNSLKSTVNGLDTKVNNLESTVEELR